MIDWQSDETHVLLNPRTPPEDRTRLEALIASAPALPGHVWLATSGTTGSLKVTALAKEALLVSAAAVNRRLDSTSVDVWCRVLPTFHVGGLGIHARAFLSGARVVELTWDALAFVATCERERVTLASLVPAQVVDLVRGHLRAPASLRAVVVGGGAVTAALYGAALELGWPILPSYGLTECCSQVATATSGSTDLRLLDHVEARATSDGVLEIRSPALLTGHAIEDAGFIDPKVEGWFATGDVGSIDGDLLCVTGRAGEFIKIGGEAVDLARLDAILAELSDRVAAAIVPVEDERLGHVIVLAYSAGDVDRIVAAFNARVRPFERIRRVRRVDRIPLTELGKLQRAMLRELVR